MKYKYKSVCTRTAQGLRRAEMLRAHGWEMIHHGFCNILFEKEAKPRAQMFVPGSEAERVYKEGRY